MSIFPAYSKDPSSVASADNDAKTTSWLSNSSFTVNLDLLKKPSESPENTNQNDTDSISSESIDSTPKDSIEKSYKHKRKHKKEKKKRKRKKEDDNILLNSDAPFYVDKTRDLLNLSEQVKRKHEHPRYEKPNKRLSGVYAVKLKMKNKKPTRYYSKKIIKLAENQNSTDDEVKSIVVKLNQEVHDDPKSISNWLNLVNFQDDYMKFQAIQFKTVGDRQRAVNNQKLAILERAMVANPDEEALQKMWLNLALDCRSVDEVENYLAELTGGPKDSLIFCLGSTMLIQQSVSYCTVPNVMKKYRSSMEKLQKSKHLNSSKQDNVTLELLFHCIIFLEQCGLWEMAWLTLKHMYSINMSMDLPDIVITDAHVLHEENKILEGSKGTPIWHLWTELEILRQGYHFLPVNSSDNFPQRVASLEDISELIHHVRKSSHFRLCLLLPMFAKIPLLPRSHSLLSNLFSQLTPWLFDSLEWQLSTAFQSSPMLETKWRFLRHLPSSHPPQYLKDQPGQLEFLKFGIEVFNKILNSTCGRERVAIGVWYLRFHRWLDRLVLHKCYEPPKNHPKTKAFFKDFLKKDENRDTVLFYVEYGLWEFENVDAKASVKTLSTIIKSKGAVLEQADEDVKADLCYLYRTLCEIQVASGMYDDAKETLRLMCRATNLNDTLKKLKHVSLEAKHNSVPESLEYFMLPNFSVDWISCYVTFLTICNSIDDADIFINDAIESSTSFVKEGLSETKLGISKLMNNKTHEEVAVATSLHHEFPFNSIAVMTIASSLIGKGGLWWRNMNIFFKSDYPIVTVIGVCAIMERQQEEVIDNRTRALLKELTSSRTSALLHRMYLKLLTTAGDVNSLETARVLSLEAFPWNKSIYIDAISSSPVQLLPLTDILVEKDLRIHITPDEIEALRD